MSDDHNIAFGFPFHPLPLNLCDTGNYSIESFSHLGRRMAPPPFTAVTPDVPRPILIQASGFAQFTNLPDQQTVVVAVAPFGDILRRGDLLLERVSGLRTGDVVQQQLQRPLCAFSWTAYDRREFCRIDQVAGTEYHGCCLSDFGFSLREERDVAYPGVAAGAGPFSLSYWTDVL